MSVNAMRKPRGADRAVARDVARLVAVRARREREHATLLRAARRVFLRRGYAATRVDDILREAGISTRALYRFHAGKDELFLELFARANAAAMARLEASVSRREEAGAQLRAYVEATLDLAYDPRLARETQLFAGVPPGVNERFADEVLACREQLVSVLRRIVERGMRQRVFARGDAGALAWALHGAFGAGLERALRDPRATPRPVLARTLRRVARGSLRSR